MERHIEPEDYALEANRADFAHSAVTVINLMSAPGAGKTTLLERSLGQLDHIRAGVLEGDIASTRDSERIAQLELPVVQIDTDSSFGGEAHLDASMVRSALPILPLDELDLLVIENVGDLVSPASYDVGEHHRVLVSSVAEGEDAPLKYPPMFQGCELVIVNKVDLLPHVAFDMDAYLGNLDAVHPGVARILLSARTGDGVGQWSRWLSERVNEHAPPASNEDPGPSPDPDPPEPPDPGTPYPVPDPGTPYPVPDPGVPYPVPARRTL